MSEDFPEPFVPDPEVDSSVENRKSNRRILLIIVLTLIVLCCCCFGGFAALYYGIEPAMELLGIPIPW